MGCPPLVRMPTDPEERRRLWQEAWRREARAVDVDASWLWTALLLALVFWVLG